MSKRKYRGQRRWEDEYSNLWDDYEDVDDERDDNDIGWDEEDLELAVMSGPGEDVLN